MKLHVLQLEKLRAIGNGLPDVVEKNEETGFFVTRMYDATTAPDLPKESPIWWQGERLFSELQLVQEKHDTEKQKLARDYSSKLNDLIRQQEAASADHQRNLHSRLSGVAGDHDGMMTSLQAAHQMKLADLEQQRVDLEARHAAALKAEVAKYAQLMKHYEAKKQELARHMAQEQKLEGQLENLKSGIISRSKLLGGATLQQAALSAKRPCMEVFMDMASQAKAKADNMLAVISQSTDGDTNPDHFDTKASELIAAVVAALLSASGAASSSRAENSMELVSAMEPTVPATMALLNRLVNPFDSGASGGGGVASAKPKKKVKKPASAEPAAKKVKAMYKHEQKEQEGFMLIGFAKGEILTLVKHRDDGWSRLINTGGQQGWGPTSFIKELPADPEPAAEEESDDDEELDLSASTGPAAADAVDTTHPEELIQTLKGLLDDAVSQAKSIQLRDRELSKLSNQLADAIEDKLSAAQQSIVDGIKLFEKLMAHSKATESGRLLEVNEQLLAIGLKLQDAMRNVINSSDGMRSALLRSKGGATDSEFNAKHESWFGALTTSVDAVVDGNPLLMEAVRCVLSRKGKHEELQVASRTITAAVAQLAALSRTKVVAEGTAVGQVTKACSTVIETGNELLAAARESQDLALASVLMEDFEDLTSNQIKRLTMATQVNLLKLEKQVELEREKLGRLRKLNYQDEA
jgi:hypothetical protein